MDPDLSKMIAIASGALLCGDGLDSTGLTSALRITRAVFPDSTTGVSAATSSVKDAEAGDTGAKRSKDRNTASSKAALSVVIEPFEIRDISVTSSPNGTKNAAVKCHGGVISL
jgi:hypothetical protein